MNQKAYKNIGIATLIMMASIFLSRLMGAFREMVIADLAGANSAVDAYRVAFVLPEILNHALASGFLSVTFIPIFAMYLTKDDEAGGWSIFSTIMTVFGFLLLVLIVACMIMAPQIVPFLAPGRKDPEFFRLAIHMTRIVLPAQIFFFAGGLLMAVQFAKERFFIPALAPLIYNLGIISGGLILGPRIGVIGFSWGALSGAFLGNFLIQLLGARKAGLQFRPRFDLRHPDLLRYMLLTLPLMLGLTMTFSMEIFSKFFGSFLPAGAISWLDYAKITMLMLVAFFGQAVGVASYPYLSRLAAEQRLEEMNRMFNTILIYLTTLVIPASVLMWVLRHEILRVLFERGHFLPHDTHMTGIALSGLLVGAVAFAAQTVVNRGFYAIQNTLLPAIYTTVAVIMSLPLYWFGLKIYGLLGVALAVSVSAIIQVAVLFSIWNRRSGNKQGTRVYVAFVKTVMAAFPLWAPLWWFHRFLSARIETASFQGSITVILLVSVLFCGMMALGGWIFKVEGILYIWRRLRQRLLPDGK